MLRCVGVNCVFLSNTPLHDHANCLSLHTLLIQSQSNENNTWTVLLTCPCPDMADGQSASQRWHPVPSAPLPSLFLSLVPRLTAHFSIHIGGLSCQRLAISSRNTKLPPFGVEKGQRAKETSFSTHFPPSGPCCQVLLESSPE